MRLSYYLGRRGRDGKPVGVWNERVSGGIMENYHGPFETLEECREYCEEYTEATRMGYNGRAGPVYIDEKHYALCSRWTSCD